MLPHVAARALREDPERLALTCIPLLRFAEAHAAHKRANKTELSTWRGNQMMELVEQLSFESVQEDEPV